MTITENPQEIYIHPPPPYEVAVNLHLWGTNSHYHTKNTLFKVRDRVRINLNWLTGSQFPSEIYHDRISTDQMQEYYQRTRLIGQEFIISHISDRGDYDCINLRDEAGYNKTLYDVCFCPSYLDKAY